MVSSARFCTRFLKFFPARLPLHVLSTISNPVASSAESASSSCVAIAGGRTFSIMIEASTIWVKMPLSISASCCWSLRSLLLLMMFPPTSTRVAPTCVPGTDVSRVLPIAVRSNGMIRASSLAFGVGPKKLPMIPPSHAPNGPASTKPTPVPIFTAVLPEKKFLIAIAAMYKAPTMGTHWPRSEANSPAAPVTPICPPPAATPLLNPPDVRPKASNAP